MMTLFPLLCFRFSKHCFFLIRFTVFDFTKPKRMSYYPHNQPIMTTAPKGDGEPSLDMPRDSTVSNSNSNTLIAAVTTIGDGSRTNSPVADMPRPSVTMPVHPDAVYVRDRVSGDGSETGRRSGTMDMGHNVLNMPPSPPRVSHSSGVAV